MTATQRREYLTRTERMTNKIIRKYQKLIRRDLDAQAMDLIKAVEKGGIRAVNEVDFAGWDQDLAQTYSKMFRESFAVAANATYNTMIRSTKRLAGMGRAEEWSLYVQGWLQEHGLKLVTTITGNSRQLYLDIANKAIQDGIDQGLGAVDIQKLITSRLADQNYTYSAFRALRVARTETIRAANEGHMKGNEALPFMTNKTWIAAHDPRTRRIPEDAFDHWDLDGMVVDSDEPFTSRSKNGTLVEAMMPGDIDAPAGFTINCRCRVAFIPKRDAHGRLIPRPEGHQVPARAAVPAVQLVPTTTTPRPTPSVPVPAPAPAPRVVAPRPAVPRVTPVAVTPVPPPKPPKAPKPLAQPKTPKGQTKTNFLNLAKIDPSDIRITSRKGIRIDIDEFRAVLKRKGITEHQFYSLAGGLPSAKARVTRINVHMDLNGSTMTLELNTNVHQSVRSVDLDNKILHNDYLKVTSKGKGTGIKLFTNLVKAAKDSGFKKMEVYAAGEYGNTVYNGYYTWARFGYDASPGSATVPRLLSRFNRKETSLFELMSTKEGQDFWKRYGQSFGGDFDLSPGSRNLLRLEEYALTRGITVKF